MVLDASDCAFYPAAGSAAGKGIQGAGIMRLIILKIKEIIELKHGCFF